MCVRSWLSVLEIRASASAVAAVRSAHQPATQPQQRTAYAKRCASCHGGEMTGGKAPSILT